MWMFGRCPKCLVSEAWMWVRMNIGGWAVYEVCEYGELWVSQGEVYCRWQEFVSTIWYLHEVSINRAGLGWMTTVIQSCWPEITHVNISIFTQRTNTPWLLYTKSRNSYIQLTRASIRTGARPAPLTVQTWPYHRQPGNGQTWPYHWQPEHGHISDSPNMITLTAKHGHTTDSQTWP